MNKTTFRMQRTQFFSNTLASDEKWRTIALPIRGNPVFSPNLYSNFIRKEFSHLCMI
jgi:hypothetical protein